MIHIIGGGTFSYVRNHLALAAPARGRTARALHDSFMRAHCMASQNITIEHAARTAPQLHLTSMADDESDLITNDDVAGLLDRLIADPETRVIILSAALCDYDGSVLDEFKITGNNYHGTTPSGSHEQRLKTSDGEQFLLLTPAPKIISRIRKERKDIFAVGFKTTTGATPDEQYLAALDLLKANSLNLVLANDTVTRYNMIVAPEETRYHETTDRDVVLAGLVEMVLARKDNTFTRSTVAPGNLYRFQSDLHVPDNLRVVVNHLVSRGAYKPFRGSTAGHFAVRLDEGRCLTSRRKTNYTEDGGLDLVEVAYDGLDNVTAYGAKPSVGGQSQRIVFDNHSDVDCIAHFHCPMREDAPDHEKIAMDMGQWSRECGSHECGRSVSDLIPDGEIRAVMIDGHGPNVVFSRNTPAKEVIAFIERNFDLEAKTGGLVSV